MRAFSFLIIFLFSLALVSFSVENTQSVAIKLAPAIEVQAPFCVALIVSMGLGALLAWLSGVWFQLILLLEKRKAARILREKDTRIQALEKDLKQYKVDPKSQNQLPPALLRPAETTPETVESINVTSFK